MLKPEHLIQEFPELADPNWRLNNLYWIKNSQGQRVKFQLNWAQQEIAASNHPLKLVLKCRQIGITTYFSLYLLDKVLWENDVNAGIIAQTFDDGSRIFKDKLKYAFDNLDPRLRPLFRIVGDSAKELAFTHGSVIRVGTSLRSSTLQYLLISEFGKICAKDPERAREVISGSIQTVHVGQNIFIESTAEGSEGYFFDMCQRAFDQQKKGTPIGLMDFQPFFFPFYKEPSYCLEGPLQLTQNQLEYFDKLYLSGIRLTNEQKLWYAKKQEILNEDMTREYPATPEEAFSASQDGYWYASIMKQLLVDGHICNLSYDKAIPVHTAWDLGQADSQCIWFFQINRQGEVNIIDYLKKANCDIAMTVSILQSKGYTYGTHIWPHDANARDRAGITFVQQAADLNLQGIVVEQATLVDGIRLVRTTLSRCWFDQVKCKEGLHDLMHYKKRWSSQLGGWTSEPIHDDSSHGADAFRYLCQGLGMVSRSNSAKSDYDALKAYWG